MILQTERPYFSLDLSFLIKYKVSPAYLRITPGVKMIVNALQIVKQSLMYVFVYVNLRDCH